MPSLIVILLMSKKLHAGNPDVLIVVTYKLAMDVPQANLREVTPSALVKFTKLAQI